MYIIQVRREREGEMGGGRKAEIKRKGEQEIGCVVCFRHVYK